VTVTERRVSELIDVLILPLRHTVYSVNLWVLKMVYPGSWNHAEFNEGVVQAFRHVTLHMDDRDSMRLLSGLVADNLIENLQEGRAGASDKAVFQSVVSVKMMGIFTASARVDEMGSAAVWVTALLNATEEYNLKKDYEAEGSKCHVRRIHKWTLKRTLPENPQEQELGDWHVVAINKQRWSPPEGILDDES